jgi:hypothetical protein
MTIDDQTEHKRPATPQKAETHNPLERSALKKLALIGKRSRKSKLIAQRPDSGTNHPRLHH